MLWREEIQVVSKALYIDDRSRNTEPNMLLRTQLVLHSEDILNLPLWESVSAVPPPLFTFVPYLPFHPHSYPRPSFLAAPLPRLFPFSLIQRDSPPSHLTSGKDASLAVIAERSINRFFFRFLVLLEPGWNVMEKKRII